MFRHCIQKSFYGDYYSGSEHMISGRIPCLFQFSLALVNICYLTILQPVDYLKMNTSYTSGTKWWWENWNGHSENLPLRK